MESAPDFFGRAFQVQLKERLLRDPVHGLIAIDESTPRGRLLVDLIDTAEFQRLRRIRQLGLAHYAFQGAEHTRFAHSIGTFHLMRRITGQLDRMYAIDSELRFFAEVAALLHDIGHGPFSHVFERFLGCSHERWTVRILHDPNTEVHRVLSGYSPKFPSIIESMLNATAKPGYLCSAVSSQLDADRMDYLLRDSLMTGVKYGVFDIDRLIHMLRISPEGDRIVIADGGLFPVEKYIQARYHMHRQVYLHKTVAAAEAMLAALLRRAAGLLDAGETDSIDPKGLLARALRDKDKMEVSDYLQLDDVELLSQIKRWAGGSDPVLLDLSRRMLNRRLFKTIEIDPSAPDFEARLGKAARVLTDAGLDPDFYLLRVDSSDTPYGPYDPSTDRLHDQILIEDGKGGVVNVSDISPTIQAFTQSAYTLSRVAFPAIHQGQDLRTSIEAIFTPES